MKWNEKLKVSLSSAARGGAQASLLTTALSALVLLSGCHAGGNITASIASVAPSPIVASPTIAAPGLSPYYSNTASITVSGVCNDQSTVAISGDLISSTPCSSNHYSFTISKAADGVYSFFLTQTGSAGTSSPSLFAWIKKTSVSTPVITAPSISPYLSGESILTVSGGCENNATVAILDGGAVATSTVCMASMFALNLPKGVDGNYSLSISQTDRAGNSAATPLVWKKHALTVTPTTATGLRAGSIVPLTITGGSGVYTINISDNQSGASFSQSTDNNGVVSYTYNAGSKANVTDTVIVSDGANSSVTLHFSTVAGVADHLVLAPISGDSQTGIAGQLLTIPLKAQVVDQYGNGLANYALAFQLALGDASFIGSPVQTSDAQGFVQMNIRLGFQSSFVAIRVHSAGATLPDAGNTGATSLTFTETSSSFGNGKFGTAFDVGGSPNAVAAGDFNSDGKIDVAVLTTNSIGIMLGKGNATFGAIATTGTGCSGTQMIAGDFNSDGKLDLAITCSGASKYQIFLGIGDGTFSPQVAVATGSNELNPNSLVAADFNGDGKLDLAIVAVTGRVVAVRFGVGNGTFGAPSEFAVDSSGSVLITGIAAGDINRDGRPDLAVTLSTGTASVLINNGSGVFTNDATTGRFSQYTVDSNPSAVAIADLDGDNYPDLITASSSSGNVTVLYGGSTGIPNRYYDDTSQFPYPSGGATILGLTVADFNLDGKLDFATVAADSNLLSLFINGGSHLFATKTYGTASSPNFVIAADVNNDSPTHIPDIILSASGSNQVQVIPIQQSAVIGFNTTLAGNPVATTSADFNGDGSYDMAVLDSSGKTITVYLNNGKGFYTLKTSLATLSTPSQVIAADFNLDGKMDLAVVGTAPNIVRIYNGNGDGTFATTPADYAVGSQPVDVVAQDFNGDGLLDLAVLNSNDNPAPTVRILINTFDSATSTYSFVPKTVNGNVVVNAVGSGPVAMAAADFSGDQNADIVVLNNSSGSISMLVSNGDGTFQTHVDYPAGNNPNSLTVGDFNGDGIADVAVASSSDANIYVLRGNGNGSLNNYTQYSAISGIQSIRSGDFTGDGKTDLVVVNSQSPYGFTLFKGTGSGSFSAGITTNSDIYTNVLQLTDANSDGKIDFILINNVSNPSVQLWMGQ